MKLVSGMHWQGSSWLGPLNDLIVAQIRPLANAAAIVTIKIGPFSEERSNLHYEPYVVAQRLCAV
jgi:hypothetical protein